MTQLYRQVLAEIGLSIERATERTPDQRLFYVFLNGESLGSHRTLAAAQKQFLKARDEAGWKPPERHLDPEGAIARDKEFAARAEYQEFWRGAARDRGGYATKRKRS